MSTGFDGEDYNVSPNYATVMSTTINFLALKFNKSPWQSRPRHTVGKADMETGRDLHENGSFEFTL